MSEKTKKEVEKPEEFTEEKQIINLVNSYTIEETNGFDYSLEQKMKDSNNTVVNSHKIVL